MPSAENAGVTIYYEIPYGLDHEPMLMINGLGGQLISWEEELLSAINEAGFSPIVFDNRDCGLSSACEKESERLKEVKAGLKGMAAGARYTLWDMAEDALAVLKAVGAGAGHVLGVSMGGMIAQCFASAYPEAALSLCSIMSTTGNREVGQPTEAALAVLLRRPPSERDEVAEQAVAAHAVIGSPKYPEDEGYLKERALAAYDRAFRPEGVARQLMAILASGDRTASLARITAPTLVVHGAADPLVTPSGGVATYKAIDGACLVLVDGMGHHIPRQIIGWLVQAIAWNARRR